jgi:hypothetical protein
VRAEGVDDDLGERDGPNRSLRLRRGQVRRPAGEGDQLAVDCQLAAEEVDPVHTDPEGLALAEPRAGGQRDQRPVRIRIASAKAWTASTESGSIRCLGFFR